MLIINEQIRIPRSEFQFDFVRSSGPGGQNVNKVNSKAILKWDITNSKSLPVDVKNRFENRFHHRIGKDGIFTISSQRSRDQRRNIEDCIFKVKELVLSIVVPPKTRIATKPSKASKRRRLEAKQRKSNKKQMRRPPSLDWTRFINQVIALFK